MFGGSFTLVLRVCLSADLGRRSEGFVGFTFIKEGQWWLGAQFFQKRLRIVWAAVPARRCNDVLRGSCSKKERGPDVFVGSFTQGRWGYCWWQF